MRKWSVRMRWRTSFLVSDRNAAPISFSRPSNCSASRSSTSTLISSVRSLRSSLPAMVSASDSSSVADRRAPRSTRRRRSPGRPGTRRSAWRPCRPTPAVRRHSARMNGLAASRPSATTVSVGACAPPAISSMTFSVASASTIMIATSSVVSDAHGPRPPCRTRRARAARRSGTPPRCRRSARRALRRWDRRTEGPRSGWTPTRR